MTLKICVAQLNFVVGDMAGNAQKIIDCATQAYQDGARLVLTPELSLCGYAAEDLFLRPSFIQACDDALKTVSAALSGLKGLHVVVGHPSGGDERTRSVSVQRRFNMASVVCEGQVVASYAKRELPNYQVFDERRYFVAGDKPCVFEVEGTKVGLLICEDAWFDAPAIDAKTAGAELLAVINASPFHVGKGDEREQAMRGRVQATGLPLIYAHLVGGQDEVVFEGRSFAIQADGAFCCIFSWLCFNGVTVVENFCRSCNVIELDVVQSFFLCAGDIDWRLCSAINAGHKAWIQLAPVCWAGLTFV